MLDRKIKDWDAGLELLLDRIKLVKYYFFVFFVIGWSITFSSAMFLNNVWDDVGMGIGIALLVFATWCLILVCNYVILIKLEKNKENK